MEFCEALAQPVGELHRPEQECTSPGHAMRQQPPLEGLVVLPDRSLCIEKEIFVVAENVSDHQANEPKNEILRAQPRRALQRDGHGRHESSWVGQNSRDSIHRIRVLSTEKEITSALAQQRP